MNYTCRQCDIPKKCSLFGLDDGGVPPDSCVFINGDIRPKWEKNPEQQEKKEQISLSYLKGLKADIIDSDHGVIGTEDNDVEQINNCIELIEEIKND